MGKYFVLSFGRLRFSPFAPGATPDKMAYTRSWNATTDSFVRDRSEFVAKALKSSTTSLGVGWKGIQEGVARRKRADS